MNLQFYFPEYIHVFTGFSMMKKVGPEVWIPLDIIMPFMQSNVYVCLQINNPKKLEHF